MDELQFLRSVEQDVQRIRTYARMSPEYRKELANLKVKLNKRIIKLLEERVEENKDADKRTYSYP